MIIQEYFDDGSTNKNHKTSNSTDIYIAYIQIFINDDLINHVVE